ncbi:hypothetical protein [Phenylobacterium sp.]|uniref:hypothetical protein n=1 Tax=Phenylobacterium sp. TaxID=1871053 RepID=UPI0025FB3155|nr:hypothetical protein [Phenylobacterium sp.]
MTSISDRDAVRREEGADLREAYERGRNDAKAARRRHPVMMTFMVIAAAIGFIVVALAVVNGSFGSAGGVVDRNLATAADKAEPAVRDAASQAGQAVRNVTDDKTVAGDKTVVGDKNRTDSAAPHS